MNRNANITDFFKPFTQPKNKRAPSEDFRDAVFSHRGTDLNKRPIWPTADHKKGQAPQHSSLARDVSTPVPNPEAAPPKTVADTARKAHTPVVTIKADEPGATHPQPVAPQMSNSQPSPNSPPLSSINTSFSSLPPLSQASTASSSKRIMKDGMAAVRTSDSEEEESDSSLEDLSTILEQRRKRPAPSTNAPAVKSHRTDSASGLRSQSRSNRRETSLIPEPPKYKHSLASLVARTKEEDEAEKRIADAKERIALAEKEENEANEAALTTEMVAAAVDNSEGGQKLLNALLRTEALETKVVWHFFDGKRPDSSRGPASRRPFPQEKVSAQGWQMILRNPPTRENAFLSGLIDARLVKDSLPDEIILWIFEEIASSPRADLTDAYIRALQLQPSQLRRLLDSQQVSRLFRQLGAKEDAANLVLELKPMEQSHRGEKRVLPSRLRWVLELLRKSAHVMTSKTRESALLHLLRLSIDDNLHENGAVQALTIQTISALITSLSDERAESTLVSISRNLCATIKDPVLQQQLIISLPYYSARESTFQRRLALAFFLNSRTHAFTTPLTSPKIMTPILLRLVKPDFTLTPSTNYATITALFVLLDTALDAGFTDLSFVSKAKKSNPDKDARDAAKQQEDDFNEGVDMLVLAVRKIMGQIRGSGTESLRMTEAKGAMERLVYRLEASVRTRQKGGGDIFSSRDHGSADFMSMWMSGGAVNGVNGV